MQFSKMENKIYGSLVTIQYHTKCANPLYPKFTSKKISDYILCCNLYLVITYVLIWPQTNVHTHLSVIAPNNVTTSSTKMHRYGIPQPIWQQIGNKTLTKNTKLGVIPSAESQQWFWSQPLWNTNDTIWVSIIFECVWLFSTEDCTIWTCTVL